MLRGVLGGFARGRRQTSAATLYLDFLAGLNDPRITFSGGANGTRVNSAGVIVAATTPRFDYDPVTLAAKGLLVEEARTNLSLYSSDFTNAAWFKSSASVAVTANATTSPDGTTNADKIYEADTSTTNREVYQTIITITASATYTGSIYVKQAERTTCQVRITSNNGTYSTYAANINLATGAVTASGTAGGMVSGSATIQAAANGFYRVIITGVFAADVTQAGVDVYCYNGTTTNYAGVVNSGFYVWGAQFEAGAFPTSYIPTTSASVTRTADSAVMTGTNFSSWYNPTESTFVTAFDIPYAVPSTSGPRVLCTADSVSEANNGQLIFSPGVTGKICAINSFSGGANAGRVDAVEANTPGVTVKAAAAFALNDRALSVNGVTPVTSSSGALPVGVDRLYIGGGASGVVFLNGHIRTLQYFPRRLPNTQLQTLTA